MRQLLASLSLAVALVSFLGAGFCIWRMRVASREFNHLRPTRLILLGSVVMLLLGVAADQMQSVVGLYSGSWPDWMGAMARTLWIGGSLMAVAATTWHRWRHGGWIILLLFVIIVAMALTMLRPIGAVHGSDFRGAVCCRVFGFAPLGEGRY